MRKQVVFYAILLLLLSSTDIFSQTDSLKQDSTSLKISTMKVLKDENGKGYYEFIGQAKGTKEELFTRAKQALYRTYDSGDAVIQMDEKEAGLIEGKGRTQTNYGKYAGFTRDLGRFSYRLTVQTKDDKYRLLFSDFVYEKGELLLKGGADIAEDYPSNWKDIYKKTEAWWAGLKKSADSEVKAIVSILDTALNAKTKDTNSRW